MEEIQWLSTIVALATIFVCIKRIKRNPSEKYVIFPVVFLMIHVLLFHFFIFLKDTGIYTRFTDFSEWSSILRFNSLITYFLLMVHELKKEGK